ncbi:MAG: YgeY family selenium metabolism-linked hydrolase, partial [Lachnospiraceae bacterium]|nr:YgeY family selenium metabolism-linked hydrolase [Lachnospiraceae bacterium]
MDFEKIKAAAAGYEKDMTKFLRELVRIPGESAEEKGHADRFAEEMRKVGFDEVLIVPQGNVIGYMGTGSRIIAFDAHIDTVGIGYRDLWKFDP